MEIMLGKGGQLVVCNGVSVKLTAKAIKNVMYNLFPMPQDMIDWLMFQISMLVFDHNFILFQSLVMREIGKLWSSGSKNSLKILKLGNGALNANSFCFYLLKWNPKSTFTLILDSKIFHYIIR